MTRCTFLWTAIALAITVAGPLAQQPQRAPDADVRTMLAAVVDQAHAASGIVVGIIEPQGRRVIAYGTTAKGGQRNVDSDTLFEIGSMTKVFTSMLLSNMADRREVALNDPVSKLLPAGVKVPQRGGKEITLIDLSTHTSGLPRLPPNLLPKQPENPYVDYTASRAYEFLSSYELPRDIGSKYEYSNFAVGLLGHALARRAGTSYEALVTSRILKPLGMTSTGITLAPALDERFAQGYSAALVPVSRWNFDALAGAGALRSSANDILTFLAATLGYTQTPLAPAMRAMLTVRRAADAGMEIALGWHVMKYKGMEVVQHDGGTGGFASFMGYDANARTGVVVLMNAGSYALPTQIGLSILDKLNPTPMAPKAHTEMSGGDPARYDTFTGRYRLAPGAFLTVTREESHLWAELTGQSRYEVFPEGDRDFFYKVVDAQITFETANNGKSPALTLHQSGRDLRGVRETAAPVRREHTQVAVDPKSFERYDGRYQVYNNVITITHDGDHLFAQVAGERKSEIFPESERDFFDKVVDVQITFDAGALRAPALTLHSAGGDLRMVRVE